MLTTLDNDCLLLICKYLDTTDHISMSSLSPTLSAVVRETYRSGNIETTANFWEYYEKQPSAFKNFWTIICKNIQRFALDPMASNHVKILRLCNLTSLKHFSFSWKLNSKMPTETLRAFLQFKAANLQCLQLDLINCEDFYKFQGLRFPNITHLELRTQYFALKSNDINAKMFPNLKTLVLKSDLQQLCLWDFTNLTELRLEYCIRLLPAQLEQILLKLPLKKLTIFTALEPHAHNNIQQQSCYKAISECQTLEELIVDYHYFCMFGSELWKLQKLRKLHFLPPSYCVCACRLEHMPLEAIEFLGKATKTLTLHGFRTADNWNKLQILFQNLLNVERLKIISCACHWSPVKALAQIMRHLKEFYFVQFGRLNYNDLLNVLKYCRNIEVFDFMETYCDEAFLKTALNIMQNDFKGRQAPLLLRFKKELMEMDDLNKTAFPEFVNVSNERIYYDHMLPGIQCEF